MHADMVRTGGARRAVGLHHGGVAAAQRGFVRGRFFLTSVRSFVLFVVHHRHAASSPCVSVCACARCVRVCVRSCVCVCGVVCCASLVMVETVRARGRCAALCARAYWYGDLVATATVRYTFWAGGCSS